MDHTENIEEWKQIEYCSNYAISNWGRVKNMQTNHILANGYSYHTGYNQLRFRMNSGENKTHKIHNLVAQHFVEKPKSDEQLIIDHIDRDRTNNMASNLRYNKIG